MSLTNALSPLISDLSEQFSGTAGVYIQDCSSGEIVSVNERTPFPTASEIKLFILTALIERYQDSLEKMGTVVSLGDFDRVLGSGILKELSNSVMLTLEDAAILMTALSDNTATNICISAAGGPGLVNDHCRLHGLVETRLGGFMDLGEIEDDPAKLGITTPFESVDFMRRLRNGEILNSEGTSMAMDILRTQQCADQFPRYMPYTIYSRDLNIESLVTMAHKTGYTPGVRTDVGEVVIRGRAFVYGVFTKGCADSSMHFENEGSVFAGKVGKILFDYIEGENAD